MEKQSNLLLIYNKPAPINYEGWERYSLPIGNGTIGANIFGGIEKDKIYLNEKTFWSGGPSPKRLDYIGGNLKEKGKYGKTIKEIQKLFNEDKREEASKLCEELVGLEDSIGTKGYGYYLSYGYLDFQFFNLEKQNIKDYKRYLDIEKAICTVEFETENTKYFRNYFVNYKSNVLVVHFKAEGENKLNLAFSVNPNNYCEGLENLPNEDSYKRDWETNLKNGEIKIFGKLKDNDLKFCSVTKAIFQNGDIEEKDNKIIIKNTEELLLITSIGTDYANIYPHYRTGETEQELICRIESYVKRAEKKGFNELLENHIKDYTNLFSRVFLNIGQVNTKKFTDKLLKNYKFGNLLEEEKRYLEVLLFQYGRYLLISSSREINDDKILHNLPSNLQGIWAGSNNSAWHSDYHMNVNLQMNYWPVYTTNLTECAKPLIEYVDSIREPGRITAHIYSGIESTPKNRENGFMAHTQNNPFGWTCPGWKFDWGWSPASVCWILQNCFEYYLYTGDKEYLKNKIYPIMKEEAIFYNQILIKDKNGKLVSSPSYSPEHGPKTSGNTYEHTLIWQLYEDTIKAAKILNLDFDKIKIWEENQKKLKGPIEIGEDGQIKEWYEETKINSLGEGYNHRHISHLLGLFPGTLINDKNKEFLKAACVSLENRTDESTGWGIAQRINTWARIGNGNKAYQLIKNLFSIGILENFWDTHPPFQIDGNFGFTSGVAEMLLQSKNNVIKLLPAIPDDWEKGEVKGLLACGNVALNIKWNKKQLEKVTLISKFIEKINLYGNNMENAKITDENNMEIEKEIISEKEISFNVQLNKKYFIDFNN